MRIVPAPRTPVGEATDADRTRACERLSTVHGREVSGGLAVDLLAQDYAACRLEGYEADQRAAEELRAAADVLTDRARTWVLNQLRDRADVLTREATT